MTFQPANSRSPFLQNSVEFDADLEKLSRQLTNVYSLIATAVNAREIGYLIQQEQLNGQQLFTQNNPLTYRYVYRQVYNCGTLPNTGVLSIPHGLDITNNSQIVFTHIYGTSTSPNTGAIPLPYISNTDQIRLQVTATNIEIETYSAAWITYSETIVVLEYVKG